MDMDAIRGAGLKIGVDPLGGAGVAYWRPIAERYGVELEWSTMRSTRRSASCPWIGRQDPHGLFVALRHGATDRAEDRFDIAFGNDTDFDRHRHARRGPDESQPLPGRGDLLSVHPSSGWRLDAAVGKTVKAAASSIAWRPRSDVRLVEVPVGFKWFVPGLLDGSLGFGGEESAGASFLRRDGTPWATDKDGFIMDLLAVELMARTGRDPSELYQELTAELGAPAYQRIDAPATARQKEVLLKLSPADVKASTLAGDLIETMLTAAPGNGGAIGGLKVVTAMAGSPRVRPVRNRSTSLRGKLSRDRAPEAHPGGSARAPCHGDGGAR